MGDSPREGALCVEFAFAKSRRTPIFRHHVARDSSHLAVRLPS